MLVQTPETAAAEIKLHSHSIKGVTDEGGLIITSPTGREITYPPEVVAKRLLNNFAETSLPNGFLGISATLSRELQSVNRQQAADAVKFLWAGVMVARDLDPNFDAPDKTLGDKLQAAHSVIEAAGRALLTFEGYQTEAAQHNFLQTVLATSGEYLAQGLFNSYLNPGAKGQLLELLRKTTDIALVNIAGQIPSEVIEQGAANLKLAEEAMAETKQAIPRAQIETQKQRVGLGVKKDEARETAQRLKAEGRLIEEGGRQELHEKALKNFAILIRENSAAFGGWWKETLAEFVEGSREFFFDPADGLVVKASDSTGKAWSAFIENVSLPTAAGFGIGSSIGMIAGFNLGLGIVKVLPESLVGAEKPILWIPTALLGIGLGSGGGYLGFMTKEWISKKMVKKDIDLDEFGNLGDEE